MTNVKIDIKRKYPNATKLGVFIYSIKSKFSILPEDMAKTYTYLATSEKVSNTTGKCFEYPNKEINPSRLKQI